MQIQKADEDINSPEALTGEQALVYKIKAECSGNCESFNPSIIYKKETVYSDSSHDSGFKLRNPVKAKLRQIHE